MKVYFCTLLNCLAILQPFFLKLLEQQSLFFNSCRKWKKLGLRLMRLFAYEGSNPIAKCCRKWVPWGPLLHNIIVLASKLWFWIVNGVVHKEQPDFSWFPVKNNSYVSIWFQVTKWGSRKLKEVWSGWKPDGIRKKKFSLWIQAIHWMNRIFQPEIFHDFCEQLQCQ